MADNKNIMDSNAQFEQEMNVNLSTDQISYICDFCGKINPIAAGKCIRCGKRRPRADYIKAMTKIKEAPGFKAEFIAEQTKIESERKEASQAQLVRIVESRVADERMQILAQEEMRLEQERESIKKSTARDAVLRIIAAEAAAEERILAAERRAEDAEQGRTKEVESMLQDERERTLQAAAEKLVAERAGIEDAARQQIDTVYRLKDQEIASALSDSKDAAERNAAKRAVLQIIAAEKAAEDKLRLSKSALQQAAVERIVEERVLADKEAQARYLAEKQAIERAADERIKAEREAVRRLMDGRGDYGHGAQTVQPFAIVPYVNPHQPVYQYRPTPQVYRFVPKYAGPQLQEGTAYVEDGYYGASDDSFLTKKQKKIRVKNQKAQKTIKEKSEGKNSVRIVGLITLILSLAVLLIAIVLEVAKVKAETLYVMSKEFGVIGNSDIVKASGQYCIEGINKIFGASIAVPDFFAGNSFYTFALFFEKTILMIPIGFILFLLFDIIILVQSIIRIATGRTKKLGFLFPLFALVCFIVTVVGIIITANMAEIKLTDAITSIGLIVFLVLGVAMTLLLGLSKNND